MAETDRPAPLVPAEVDLRGYEWMPYYGERLRTSELNSRVTDAEYRAAHNLWWSAWRQVPAASLPDDDVILTRLADLARDIRAWRAVREGALRGFIHCSDGRLYHSVLAPLAIQAWAFRQAQRARARQRWDKSLNKNNTGNAAAYAPAMPLAMPPGMPGQERKEQSSLPSPLQRRDPVDNSRCAYPSCPNRGTVSRSTNGQGKWYCQAHSNQDDQSKHISELLPAEPTDIDF